MTSVAGGSGAATTRRLSRTERTIAARMVEACRDVPSFTVSVAIQADGLLQQRAKLRRLQVAPLPSLNDLIVKACAVALRAHPRLNASYRDGELEEHDEVNVGVAVAGEDALLVPVVRGADALSLTEIAAVTRSMAEAARGRSLSLEQMSGGTFTVSNLGMLGVDRFTAIIQPPQAAILAVGGIREELAREDEAVVDRAVCELTLTSDHRIVYGAHAAAFLATLRELLERPEALG